MRRLVILVPILLALSLAPPRPGAAQQAKLRLRADQALVESGIIRFLIPRFSLKNNIAVELRVLGPEGGFPPDADALLSAGRPEGAGNATPVMEDGAGQLYSLILPPGPAAPAAERLLEWLRSPSGRRTIEQFAPEGAPPFSAPRPAATASAGPALSGDPARGEELSYQNCGRCHVIGPRNRMKSIGSTPSFAALRALADWQERFETFYVRNPHPAVVQLAGITAPFSVARPPPIRPVEITQEEFEDILAYVAALAPADLGAPVRHQ